MADVLSTTVQIDSDPDTVSAQSTYYASIAEAVRTTVSNLRAATDTSATVSEAVAAFSEVAVKVAESLGEVDDRYQTVADQLARFAREVRQLRESADSIQSQARSASSDRASAVYRRDHARTELLSLEPDDPRLTEVQQDYVSYRDQVEEFDGVVAARQRDLDQLMDDWRALANSCAEAINGVVDGSDLNDSGWDKFCNWMEEALPVIQMIIDIASIVLTVLAFLAVLTGVGAALAPLLFALARGLQLLSKVIKVARIAYTLLAVATGRLAPTALVQLGIDMAVDKVLGKVADGVGDRLIPKAADALGGVLARGVNPNGTLLSNLDDIAVDGFDDWVKNEFSDAVKFPSFRLADGSTMDLQSIPDQLIESPIKWLDDHILNVPTDLMGLSNSTTYGYALDGFAGPKQELSDLGWRITNMANDRLHDAIGMPDFTALPDLPGASDSFQQFTDGLRGIDRRPSVESVVAAS